MSGTQRSFAQKLSRYEGFFINNLIIVLLSVSSEKGRDRKPTN